MYRIISLLSLVVAITSNLSHSNAATPQVINITAEFYYKDISNQLVPLRYSRIEIWLKLYTRPDILLKVEYLGNNQYLNTTITDTGIPRNIYIKVFSRNDYSVNVVSEITQPNTTYYYSTDIRNNGTGNVIDFGAWAAVGPTRAAFYIYDMIADNAWNYLKQKVNWDNNFNDLIVEWTETSAEAARYQQGTGIWLNRVNGWEPDIFLHEYGHYVESKVYVTWPGVSGCFAWGDAGSEQCAWREGWPTFLQGAIQGESDYYGTAAPGGIANSKDMERPFPFAYGSAMPGAVAAYLWDIFDPKNETCDHLYNDINGSNNNGIWKIFFTNKPTTIIEFRSYWIFSSNGFNNEVIALAEHHGISNNIPCRNKYTYLPILLKP